MDSPTLLTISTQIARLDEKLDAYMRHELPDRVRSLENSRSWAMGLAAAGSFTLAWVGHKLTQVGLLT